MPRNIGTPSSAARNNDSGLWAAVTFSETLDLVARGIDRRLTDEYDTVACVQGVYDDMKDPKKREARLAHYRKIAPLQKDPAYMEKMMNMEAVKEEQADTLLPQIAIATAVVTKSERDLASIRKTAVGSQRPTRRRPPAMPAARRCLSRGSVARRLPAATRSCARTGSCSTPRSRERPLRC